MDGWDLTLEPLFQTINMVGDRSHYHTCLLYSSANPRRIFLASNYLFFHMINRWVPRWWSGVLYLGLRWVEAEGAGEEEEAEIEFDTFREWADATLPPAVIEYDWAPDEVGLYVAFYITSASLEYFVSKVSILTSTRDGENIMLTVYRMNERACHEREGHDTDFFLCVYHLVPWSRCLASFYRISKGSSSCTEYGSNSTLPEWVGIW